MMENGKADTPMPKITPFLWFNQNAEEASEFYTSIFKESKILDVQRLGGEGPGPKGSVMYTTFRLDGQEFMALNGGPLFKFTEAVSFMVMCENQAEVDRYWAALSEGGQESQCGWLKDRFGLSWQIVPTQFMQMMQDQDAGRFDAVMTALLGMQKIDIATLERAYKP